MLNAIWCFPIYTLVQNNLVYSNMVMVIYHIWCALAISWFGLDAIPSRHPMVLLPVGCLFVRGFTSPRPQSVIAGFQTIPLHYPHIAHRASCVFSIRYLSEFPLDTFTAARYKRSTSVPKHAREYLRLDSKRYFSRYRPELQVRMFPGKLTSLKQPAFLQWKF